MLLQIQNEESLRSYVERNIYVGWKQPHVEIFERLSKYSIGAADVKVIASVLNWRGCYGFNRLLHHHTNYPQYSIFKNIQDMSYSQRRYISAGYCYGSDRTITGFCPECVRGDLKSLGFSYWRRSHSTLKVCAAHNVTLVTSCPFCEKPFCHEGHGLDVMWNTCGGHHLSECEATRNDDALELKKAKFFEEISSSKTYICEETALTILHKKISRLGLSHAVRLGESDTSIEFITRVLHSKIKKRLKNNGHFMDHSSLIFELLVITYDDFSDFLEDLRFEQSVCRPVESLWSTYRSGGCESAHYVAEDYSDGVGHWSCPYPSELSLDLATNDGYASRRAMIYICCNYKRKKMKGHQLKARRVDPAPPGVPRTSK